MKVSFGSSTARALCVSILTTIALVVVPLYALGHVHHLPDPATISADDSLHQSYGSCLICRLANDRVINDGSSPTVEAPAPITVTPLAAAHGTRRGAAGPLTSRGPPSIS